MSWQRFEREAAGYEAWYATPRGRRADRAECGLLELLMVPLAPPRSALEIGCGTGHFTQWLAGRLPSVVGLDHAPAMLAQARRHPRLRLVRGDAHQLPFRNRAVDLSVFITTLEFLEQPALALTEAVRVARRGVLVVALNRWSLGGLSRRVGRDSRRSLLSHAADFTLASLRELTTTAAGPRLRALQGAGALFPGDLARKPARMPFGGVLGIAVELAP